MNRGWRATLFGAALYMMIGVNLPYLPVWMEQVRGLSGAGISGIVALGTLIHIFTAPTIAAEAERTGLRRMLWRLSLVTFLAYCALVPVGPVLLTALLVAVTYVTWGAFIPLTESLLLAATGTKRPDYGTARALASCSFIAASLAVGAAVRAYGPDLILWTIIAASAFICIVSLFLSPDRPVAVTRRSFRETLKQGFLLYRNRRLLLLALGTAFIQSAHAYYYNLGSNIWIAQGIDEAHIGALWSIGVAVEAVLLLVSGWLFSPRRWTPGGLVLLGGIGAVIRWTLTGFAPPLPILYALQTLHALSFATTLVGTLRFLEEEIAPEKVPIAMSINSALAYGPMLAGFGLIAGVYYDFAASGGGVAQAKGFWLMAGAAALGCFCAPAISRRVPERAELTAV